MNKTLGQIAYEAFVDAGDMDWSAIADTCQESWEEAAKAVVEAACEHDIYQCEGVSWNYMQRHKGHK